MWGDADAWKFMDALHANIAQYTHSGSKPCRQAGAGESSGDWTVVSNAKMSKVTALSNFKCNRMNAVIPGSLVIHPELVVLDDELAVLDHIARR